VIVVMVVIVIVTVIMPKNIVVFQPIAIFINHLNVVK